MKVKLLSWLMLIALLLLLQSKAEAQEPEPEPDGVQHEEAESTTEMEMATSYQVMSTAMSEPVEPMEHETKHVPESEPEPQPETDPEPQPETDPEPDSGKAMEHKTTATATESTHMPDYQDDDGAPQEATTSAMPVPTATVPAAATTAAVAATTLPVSCYSCSSYQNGSCLQQPSERQQCQLKSQRTGCYTLVKRDTKLIMRGCTADLTEEGDKYCRKEAKLCNLCSGLLCNKDVAPVPAGGASPLLGSLALWSLCFAAVLGYI